MVWLTILNSRANAARPLSGCRGTLLATGPQQSQEGGLKPIAGPEQEGGLKPIAGPET